ncbi:MAG TPA: RDD family protein, partial [Bacteroidia bacterium]|nr:RDD family protein [Bacteroidia bacterium]
MEPVVINTSQNVVIDYEPAGLGNRLLAGIIDLLFKIGFLIVIGIVLGFIGDFFDRENDRIYNIIYYLLIFLPYICYDLLFEIFMHGQTLGKKIMKIKIVKLDGTQPSVGSYLLRWFIRLLEIDMCWGLIAIISVASSKNSQRLGDMAAGTTVIRIKPAVTLQDTILQQKVHQAHEPVFKEVALLTDADIQLIKDVYDFSVQTGHT